MNVKSTHGNARKKSHPQLNFSTPDLVDDAAVDRAIGGDHTVVLIPAELAVAIDTMDRRGLRATGKVPSGLHVARTIGCCSRTVYRRRRRRNW